MTGLRAEIRNSDLPEMIRDKPQTTQNLTLSLYLLFLLYVQIYESLSHVRYEVGLLGEDNAVSRMCESYARATCSPAFTL